jgi:hypothetical protein
MNIPCAAAFEQRGPTHSGASVCLRPALQSQAQPSQPVAGGPCPYTTRQALETARSQWPRVQYHARRGEHRTAEHTKAETVLVVGALTIGYRSTGDQWLALAAAAKAREQTTNRERKRSSA